MIELPSRQIDRLLPFYDPGMPNRAMIYATLEGRTPGRAWVDDLDTPSTCVVVIHFHNLTFYPRRLEQAWLDRTLPRLREEEALVLSWTPAQRPGLSLPLRPEEVYDRFEFSDRRPTQAPAPLPPGAALRRIDRALLARCAWREMMVRAHGSEAGFLQEGFGLCLMREDEILCEVYAVFLGANCFEIGVFAPEAHRRQGYATVACDHLARACEAQGHDVHWSCEQDNLGSAATARKLGFRRETAHQWLVYPRNGAC